MYRNRPYIGILNVPKRVWVPYALCGKFSVGVNRMYNDLAGDRGARPAANVRHRHTRHDVYLIIFVVVGLGRDARIHEKTRTRTLTPAPRRSSVRRPMRSACRTSSSAIRYTNDTGLYVVLCSCSNNNTIPLGHAVMRVRRD